VPRRFAPSTLVLFFASCFTRTVLKQTGFSGPLTASHSLTTAGFLR
jgi:hypothetical protein